MSFRPLLCGLILLGVCGAIAAANSEASSHAATDPIMVPQSFASLAAKVLPAVVTISAAEPSERSSAAEPGKETGSDSDEQAAEEWLRRLFGDQGTPSIAHRRLVALGSGFIIDPSGYIVTNAHLVKNAQAITVMLQDGTHHPARIIGQDLPTDLALLKVDLPVALPFVSWGNSEAAKIGDWILAIGDPFGLGTSISPGVISGRGRDINVGPYDDFLQIDATINIGNSGGPAFNAAGEVIGVVTAIYSTGGGSIGIGFAMPSSMARPIIEQLRARGKIERGWIGLSVQEVTEKIATSFSLPEAIGALVTDVTPNSPGVKAGIKPGDIVLQLDGREVASFRDFPRLVAQAPIGEEVEVKIWRRNRIITVHATIAAMPEAKASTGDEHRKAPPVPVDVMGLQLESLTPELRDALDLPPHTTGAVVTDIMDDSVFADVGLEPGDIIEQVDRENIHSPEDAVSKLGAAQRAGAGTVLLFVRRRDSHIFVVVDLRRESQAG